MVSCFVHKECTLTGFRQRTLQETKGQGRAYLHPIHCSHLYFQCPGQGSATCLRCEKANRVCTYKFHGRRRPLSSNDRSVAPLLPRPTRTTSFERPSNRHETDAPRGHRNASSVARHRECQSPVAISECSLQHDQTSQHVSKDISKAGSECMTLASPQPPAVALTPSSAQARTPLPFQGTESTNVENLWACMTDATSIQVPNSRRPFRPQFGPFPDGESEQSQNQPMLFTPSQSSWCQSSWSVDDKIDLRVRLRDFFSYINPYREFLAYIPLARTNY